MGYLSDYNYFMDRSFGKRSFIYKRILSVTVDILILRAVCFLLSYPLSGVSIFYGNNGSFIGFLLVLFYFTFLNSRIFGGGTIGKLIYQLRVVDKKGDQLSLFRSFCRYIFPIFIFFMSSMHPFRFFNDQFISYTILSILIVFTFGELVWLLYFPSHTTLFHDYITSSMIIPVNGSINQDPHSTGFTSKQFKIWIIVSILALSVFFAWILRGDIFDKEIFKLNREFHSTANVQACNFVRRPLRNTSDKNFAIDINIYYKDELPLVENLVKQPIVSTSIRYLMDSLKSINSFTIIQVNATKRFDMGIYKKSNAVSVSYPIECWHKLVH